MSSYYTFSYTDAEGNDTSFGVPFGSIRAYDSRENPDSKIIEWDDLKFKITSPAPDLFDFFAKHRGLTMRVDTGGVTNYSFIGIASNLVDTTINTIKTNTMGILTSMYGSSSAAVQFKNAIIDECVDAVKSEVVILSFNTTKITTPIIIDVQTETEFVYSNKYYTKLGNVLNKYQYEPATPDLPTFSPGNFGINNFARMIPGISFYKLTGAIFNNLVVAEGGEELDISTCIVVTTSGNTAICQCPALPDRKYALDQLRIYCTNVQQEDDMRVYINGTDTLPFATPVVSSVIPLPFSVSGYSGANTGNAFSKTMTYNALFCLVNNSDNDGFRYRITHSRAGNTTFFFLRANDLKPLEPSENNPDDEPKPEGGDGDRDKGTTPIPHPSVPQISTGNMVHVYRVTSDALTQLHDYLWTKDFFENILKIINNPRDCLVSLYSLPVNYIGPSDNIQLGNVTTQISGNVVPQRYFQYNIVSTPLRVTKYYGTFLDYEPYTSIDIYLPYYGYYHLSCSQVYDVNITVNLVIDMYAGYAMYNIMFNGSVIAQVACNMATQLPLSINDMTGATAAVVKGAVDIATGSVISGVTDAATGYRSQPLMASDVGGGSGILSLRKVHIRRTIPTRSVSNNFPSMVGLKSTQGVLIGDISSGYFKVLEAKLDEIPCTDEEKKEIETMLKTGVRF